MLNAPSKRLIIVQIFLIFVLPVAVLYFGILPPTFRIPLLFLSAIFIFGIIHFEKWTEEEMGMRTDNFKIAWRSYYYFTLAGLGTLAILSMILTLPNTESKDFLVRTFSLFLPVSFFQEFAFRSFLIPRLKRIFSDTITIILVNAFLFTLIHVIYPNWGVTLPISFASGILFAWLYIKYPNLYLATFSHMILNLVAVLLGFFYIQ